MQVTDYYQRKSFLKTTLKEIVRSLQSRFNALAACHSRSAAGKTMETIAAGYAQVFFSKHRISGLFFCLATFVIPSIGAAGLFGLVLSYIFARKADFSKDSETDAYFACNGLLTALALAFTYKINLPCAVMLALSMILGVFISSALRTFFEHHLSIPALSLPFIITTWIALSACRKFSGLVYSSAPFEIELLNGFFPEPVDFLFRSFGAVFFQLSVPSGILAALGILVYSRHAFIMASSALFAASFFHTSLGGSTIDLSGQWIGFNFALTAIAVGGMFVVPGMGTYILAFASALITSLVAAGMAVILTPLGLPVLALPFVFTTLVIIYTLRKRMSHRHLIPILYPKESPEANLKQFNNPRARFVTDTTPSFYLPVSGEWTVIQGMDDTVTHKGPWAHALDLEVTDESGKTWQSRGDQLSNYYAWHMPVFAPADGIITQVISHHGDNPVGQVNILNNWGNTVIIWHYGTVYSSMSHLAKDSVCVSVGDRIQKGNMIGKVGNSGRSPYPHLHFQVQYSPELGAHTAPFKILNYVSEENRQAVFHLQNIPRKNQVIQSLQTDPGMLDTASFPVGGCWCFDVCSGDKRWQETWESGIDFLGNRFLRCCENKGILRFFMNNDVLLLLDYHGPSNTALEWFFLGAPCVPFTQHTVYLCEKMPAEKKLNPLFRFVYNCAEPLLELASLSSYLHISPMGMNSFTITSSLTLKRSIFSKQHKKWEIQTFFDNSSGLISLQAACSGQTTFSVSQRKER